MQPHTANGKIILSIMKQKKNEEISERNEYALKTIKSLKEENPDKMVWTRYIHNSYIFLVIDPETREMIKWFEKFVDYSKSPLSGDEFFEYLTELTELISEPPNWFKRWEDSQVGSLEHSIDRFLEENVELSEKVSFEIQMEHERFHDSKMFD